MLIISKELDFEGMKEPGMRLRFIVFPINPNPIPGPCLSQSNIWFYNVFSHVKV